MAEHDSVFNEAQDALQIFQERRHAMQSAVEKLQTAREKVSGEISALISIRDNMTVQLREISALFGSGDTVDVPETANLGETTVEGDAAQTSKVLSEREETVRQPEEWKKVFSQTFDARQPAADSSEGDTEIETHRADNSGESPKKKESPKDDRSDSKPLKSSSRKATARKETKPAEAKIAPVANSSGDTVEPDSNDGSKDDADLFADLKTPENPSDIDDELWSAELDFPDEDDDSIGTSEDLNNIKF